MTAPSAAPGDRPRDPADDPWIEPTPPCTVVACTCGAGPTVADARREARRDALAPILALHRRKDGVYPYCAGCDHNWPCSTAAAAGEPTPGGEDS